MWAKELDQATFLPQFSQSLHNSSSLHLLPKSNRLPCLRKKISKRTWCISNTHTPSCIIIFKRQNMSRSVQCSHKNKSSGFQCPAKNSCSKQHTATWETHTTQIISKSCFLRWKDYGLDGSILQIRPALSLRAEPCLHKQTEKLLNMVAKSLLAASVQEETWS